MRRELRFQRDVLDADQAGRSVGHGAGDAPGRGGAVGIGQGDDQLDEAFIDAFGVAAGFERPALAAFEAQVIPIEFATRGASWIGTVWTGGAIIGPAMGGLLIAIVGLPATYAVITVMLLLSVLFVTRNASKGIPEQPEVKEGFVESLAAGVRYVGKNQILVGSMALDLFGPYAAPAMAPGFGLTLAEANGGLALRIDAGRYYVQGILCESEGCDYLDQPHFTPGDGKNGEEDALRRWLGASNRDSARFFVYLKVWERHVTSLEMPHLREVALGHHDQRPFGRWAVRRCLRPEDDLEGHARVGHRVPPRLVPVGDHRVDAAVLHVVLRLGLGGGEEQKPVDEVTEPVDLGDRAVVRLSGPARQPEPEDLESDTQRRERIAQGVRGVRDKPSLRLPGSLDVGCHRTERSGQLAHLGRPEVLFAARRCPGRIRGGARGQAADQCVAQRAHA